MTVVEIPSGTHVAQSPLGAGRFRLDERISLDDQLNGPCGPAWEARGLSLWKATDQLLGRAVTIYLLPPGIPVPGHVVEAVQAAARVNDPRLATVYDTDFGTECPYIVAEWAPGTHLEDLVLSGLPQPALAAAMIADAADAIAVAHRAGRPHLRLTPRSLRWDNGSGLKITGLGVDAALCGPDWGGPDWGGPDWGGPDWGGPDWGGPDWGGPDWGGPEPGHPATADATALARMLYALLTGYWPGEDATALPSAPRYRGRVCTPRQVRAGVPAMLDAIAFRGLQGQAADAPLRPQTPAGLAMALRMVQRPSYRQAEEEPVTISPAPPRPRHARPRPGPRGSRHRLSLTTLLRSA